jgi:hypothetical protein
MYRHPEDDIIVLSRTVPKAQSIAALILCVESLTEAGFANAGISLFWNPWIGYLGGLPVPHHLAKSTGATEILS